MRKALLLLIVLLTVTGVPLVWVLAGESAPAWRKALVLAHIWGGFIFLVVFPLYAWDHISTHRAWLRFWAWVTVSGVTQLVAGALLLLSGLVLLIYQSQSWDALRALHHWLTYVLLAALGVHFLAMK